jgi:hypothetical protein
MSSVKRAAFTSVCIALCVVLPLAFHAVGLGAAFSPLHIPALFCGLLCGPWYGFFCGTAGVVISWLTTGMPSAAQLVYMLPELAVYGAVSGLLFRRIRTGSLTADLLLSLVPAMLLGRIVGGLARLVYLQGAYSLSLWFGAYVLTALPGILLHLILLPTLYLLLKKIKVIPPRESKGS